MNKISKIITTSFFVCFLIFFGCNEEESTDEVNNNDIGEVINDENDDSSEDQAEEGDTPPSSDEAEEDGETPNEEEEPVVVDETAEEEEEEEEEDPVVVVTPGDTNAEVKCDVFNEDRGIVIMEAENTKSDLGLWKLENNVKGYKGTGHLEFTGNRTSSGPPTSPLEYTFKVNKGGTYRLIIRSRKRITPPDEDDKSNDSFVRVEGDFTLPDTIAKNLRNIVPLKLLKRDFKMFGGAKNGWGWSLRLDKHDPGNEKRKVPYYEFKSGETYTLVVSGRSKQYNIDRIIFYNIDDYRLAEAQEAGKTVDQNLCL